LWLKVFAIVVHFGHYRDIHWLPKERGTMSSKSSAKASPVVAFQGESGAYSEQATHQFFGEQVVTLPCHTFIAIFNAVDEGKADYGMLPIENSLAGTVVPAYSALLNSELRIQAEVIVKIEHCLLGPAGSRLETIERAQSHPQALSQCEQTLLRLGIEPVSYYDTAGAARDLAANPEPGTAAIAGELAARKYGLEVLAREVADYPANFTRFFVLGTTPVPRRDPSKTSIIFTTGHVPGALHAVLAELARRKINLTKIESRPYPSRPWHYLFYLDFEGHKEDPGIAQSLQDIANRTSFLKVLGSYPAAPGPDQAILAAEDHPHW
jgi:prephenate dehydratase